MILRSLDRFRDFGFLIVRVGLGGIFFFNYGGPLLLGGVERWKSLGSSMAHLGIDFAPVFWGFMAAFSECIGGLFLILGLAFRPVTALLFFTMIVAANMHIQTGKGDPWHAIELGIVFAALFFTGPGKFALDERMK